MRRVLFVCTGNAGRSQIAEVLFTQRAVPDTVAYSAGVAPWDHLHPMAVRLLKARGIDTAGRHPKPVSEFTDIALDCVVLIGDRALAEAPSFKGNPPVIHWDIADPADADGTGREEAVFRRTLETIERALAGFEGSADAMTVR